MDPKNNERGEPSAEDLAASGAGAPAGAGSKKRRLGLLSEVLPDPTRRPEGSARQRTLRTMDRLAQMAAASALIAGCGNNHGSGGEAGYGVVDPMPPPARCPGLAGSITAKAVWRQGTSGLYIELTLAKPSRADAQYASAEEPSVYGATVLKKDAKEGALLLELAPGGASGSVYVNVVVGVTCSQGPGHVQLSLQTSTDAQPKDGDGIPVTADDAF